MTDPYWPFPSLKYPLTPPIAQSTAIMLSKDQQRLRLKLYRKKHFCSRIEVNLKEIDL